MECPGSQKFVMTTAMMLSAFLTCAWLAEGDVITGSVAEKRLVKPAPCPGQAIAEVHRYQILRARCLLECVSHCRLDVSCLSIVFNTQDRKCHLGNSISSQNCSNMVPMEEGMRFYETYIRSCDDPIEVLGPDGLCVCAEGFRGHPCQPYIGDCREGFEKGHFSKGVNLIHPLQSSAPFSVYCFRSSNNARTYILERNNNLTFNRNFSEYKTGFGDLNGSHWLGLERVFQLTNSKPYYLRIAIRAADRPKFSITYKLFRISGADSGYQLILDNNKNKTDSGSELFFTQTMNETDFLGDCFTPLKDARFSAYDNDNDEDHTVNCAVKYEGGWWFRGSSCSTCNPTGPLLMPADGFLTGVDGEAFWKKNLRNLSLYQVSMYLIDF